MIACVESPSPRAAARTAIEGNSHANPDDPCRSVCRRRHRRGSGAREAQDAEEDGERYALAEVRLAQSPPVPQAPQPPSLVPGIAYFLVDTFLPAIAAAVYRRGKRQWRSI